MKGVHVEGSTREEVDEVFWRQTAMYPYDLCVMEVVLCRRSGPLSGRPILVLLVLGSRD